MSSENLSPAQAHALFDILTHHETYANIVNFKSPDAIHTYGHPFKTRSGTEPTSPILHGLFQRFILPAPGIRDVNSEFWTELVQPLIEKLSKAELSESYDKGTIGSRKTLATAISAILEVAARGVLGGFSHRELAPADTKYDLNNADDLVRSFVDFSQRIIYDDMLDELFRRVAETDNIEEHSHLLQASHEFMLIIIASFLHHILILSGDGPYLVNMISNTHKLVPYGMIRQTLRVGNAATMINGMVKLMLTKLSVSSITSWFGIWKDDTSGMNLLQYIISTVLSWDSGVYQKKAAKLAKDKNRPSKEHLTAIDEYMKLDREIHDKCRQKSIDQSKSIVQIIFEHMSVDTKLSKAQHAQALEYYQMKLSIRDRDEINKVLCQSQPDLMTQIVRELVTAYDPIIRVVHNAVDLSSTVTDAQNFIDDLIKIANPSKNASTPSVEQFVNLLRKHQNSFHRFLHQFIKNAPDAANEYLTYCHQAAGQFRHSNVSQVTKAEELGSDGAGTMTRTLNDIFSKLSEKERTSVVGILDEYARYLDHLHKSSRLHIRAIVQRDKHTKVGPGMYLARWQSLLDETLITPATAEGPVRRGRSDDVAAATKKAATDGFTDDHFTIKSPISRPGSKDGMTEAPDCSEVLNLFGERFHKALASQFA